MNSVFQAQAATLGLTKYTSVNGDIYLRKAIVDDLRRRKGVEYSTEQIVVANGAKQAVLQGLLAVVSPDDDVIIPAPYWTSYPDMVKICQGNPVYAPTLAADDYVLKSSSLRKTLESHPKTSCIILCNPSNPTGSVMNADQLREIVDVLEEYPQVIIIADEIYEQLVYEDMKHTSLASFSSIHDRVITINGFSKSHAMTGYRLGYSASSLVIAKACSKIQSQITSCASSISQHSGLVALTQVDDSWIHDRIAELEQKRDLAYSLLLSIPHISCPRPQGAFYLLPNVAHYFGLKTQTGKLVKTSHELCLELLRDHQVAVVSGDAFGAPDCLRISYATSESVITESLIRLKSFLNSLN